MNDFRGKLTVRLTRHPSLGRQKFQIVSDAVKRLLRGDLPENSVWNLFNFDRREQIIPRVLHGTRPHESIRTGARPTTRFSERSASALSTSASGYVPETTGFTRPEPTHAAASANSAWFT